MSILAATPGGGIDVAVPLDRFEATSSGRVLRGAGPVDPGSVTSVGFLLAEKTPGPFALAVAWIKTLRVVLQ
jgi:monofunctional biosynthetic peptidoglycan transglycosylase